MSTSRPLNVPGKPAVVEATPSLGDLWNRFWFTPIDPVGLHTLRVLAGLLFLFWLLPLAGQTEAMFGLGGWFDAAAYKETSHLPMLPPHLFSWSVFYACGTNAALLKAAYWVAIVVICVFTLGLWTRITGVLTWLFVVSFTANPAIAYDSDPFFLMLAFYLMVGYLLLGQWGRGVSWSERLLGARDTWLFRKASLPQESARSVGANLAVRLLQVHFALAIFAMGMHKLQVREWWSGLALWFYIHPPLSTTLAEIRSSRGSAETQLTLLSLAAYLTLAWQLAFPVFAWRKWARPLLLGGAAIALVADAFLLGLPLMGPITAIGCLNYLTPATWRQLVDYVCGLPGLQTLWGRPVPEVVAPSGRGTKSTAAPVGHRG